MSEERKTIYLCLAHMSEEGWEQKFVKEAFDRGSPITYGSDNHGPGYPDAQALVEEYLGKVGFKSENFSMPKFRTY